tara:strand:- start:353 stop:634 length:282 start_codon:yes stop_codon:yes gene_type:complete
MLNNTIKFNNFSSIEVNIQIEITNELINILPKDRLDKSANVLSSLLKSRFFSPFDNFLICQFFSEEKADSAALMKKLIIIRTNIIEIKKKLSI